ncbi:MAG: glycosyltransferase [Lentisphaeria bacterium]
MKNAVEQVQPRVSIVVRSHNDIQYIRETLSILLTQNLQNVEILSCDDDSNDGTRDAIKEFSEVRILARPAGSYVPGRTLNQAVQACRGQFVVFNNADAVPCRSDYLAALIAPFQEARVSAVYGNQLCRPDAELLVRKDHERAFGDGVLATQWGDFFSLASSAIRRDILLHCPFSEELQYSEDVEWAKRCRSRGEKIAYAPAAQVQHSHNYRFSELRKRFYNEGLAAARIFGGKPSFLLCLRHILMETLRDFVFLIRRGGWREIPKAPLRRLIQKIAFYRGERDFFRR